jgi:hypothetical protein
MTLGGAASRFRRQPPPSSQKADLIEKTNPRWEDLAQNLGRSMRLKGESIAEIPSGGMVEQKHPRGSSLAVAPRCGTPTALGMTEGERIADIDVIARHRRQMFHHGGTETRRKARNLEIW